MRLALVALGVMANLAIWALVADWMDPGVCQIAFLGAIGRAITKPFRGVGRILRGKFREGLSDIGGAAETLAPALALTGVGAPLAIGIGAGGSALEEAAKGGNVGDILKGAAGGGAKTGLAYIGKGLVGKGGTSPDPFARAAGEAGAMASRGAGLGARLADVGRSVAGYAKENPSLALQAAGAGAQAYGAHEQGKALDKQIKFERERELRDRERREAMDPLMQEILKRILAPRAA